MTKKDTPQQAAKATSMDQVKRWLPLVAIVLATAFGLSQGWHEHLSLDTLVERRAGLRAHLADNHAIALIGYAAVYTFVVAISLPGAAALTILGGFLFGWLIGGLVTVVAATIGACLIFMAARSSLGESLQKRAGPFLNRLSDGFREDALSYILFLRLVPLFPFWLINLAPAFLGVPLRSFAVGTFFGIVPGTFAFAFIGSGLDSVIEAQAVAADCDPAEPDCDISLEVSALVTPELIGAFVALGIVALIPPVLKKLRAKR